MARQISGLRIARSMLSPTGAQALSVELDFQLGSDQGIAISAVVGGGLIHDDSMPTSDTVPATTLASQTLHMETGTLEDFPLLSAQDEFDIDTEIFYAQSFQTQFHIPATAGGGGGSQTVTPNGIVVFAEPIQTARNITHRAETGGTDQDLECWLMIYYRYIQFTNAELGFLLARRQ